MKTTKWSDLRRELYDRDPGAVARVDQARAGMEHRYNRWWWRLIRWLDGRRT